jgi:hypothetical protein
MSRYRLYVAGEQTEHAVEGRSPARALRELVQVAGVKLVHQDGRYGRLEDGRRCSALTEPWGRAHYADARTTRV